VIDGDAVIHELVLPAPAGQVFDMFTDPRQLIRWIGSSAELQPQPPPGSGLPCAPPRDRFRWKRPTPGSRPVTAPPG
jgi:uncharacterized protein YndB with AHSA1/START domain